MKKLTTSLMLTGIAGFSALLSSCADKPKEEEAAKPVEQPKVVAKPVAPAPAPVEEVNPTAAFRTPSDDTNLPTAEQLADGAESSIGTGSQKVTVPNTQPSTAIKPPSAAVAPPAKSPPATASTKEDDLAPAE
ncbi:hypothetical protein NT6N_22310 [Oceaniferula spumae]|uniref:Uncharacterized protein n=1 Tax=Oceaniferula spumae TaxID=2979115 RepID=A0AAT9FMI1_9BACT